jgi:uncharacterized protein YeeX (DUF496 family)
MEETKHTSRKKKAGIVKDVKDVASGKKFFDLFWIKQRRYFLLLFVLAVLYISQRYSVERTVYAAKEMEKELEKLRTEYTIRSSELMRLCKRSSIEQEIKRRGMELVAPQCPPKQIKID